MGRDKLLLQIEGETLLRRTVRRLATFCDEVLVVGRAVGADTAAAGGEVVVRGVTDVLPGEGSLGGVLTGLELMAGERGVVVAGDMPYLNPELLADLAERLAADPALDALVPRIDGLVEPLHAVYRRGCAGAIRAQIERGERRVVGFFDAVRVGFVERDDLARLDPGLLSFVNVNTPAELAEALTMPARGASYTPAGQRLGGGRSKGPRPLRQGEQP